MTKGQAQPWEVLVTAQKATGTAISKLLLNLNRLGQDNITIDVLKARLLQLDTYWKNFFDKHQNVYAYAEELKENDYFTQDYFSAIEEVYLDTKIQLTTQLSAKVEAVQALVGLPVNDTQGASPAISTTVLSLPKLTLPRFSGRQEDWESFKELFCSMVKDSPSLTPVLKLQHLISCLEGDARRRVGNMTIVGANFEVAWNTLEKRYDNKRLRLTVQLNRLLSMRPTAEKSVAEITRLLDTTNQCVRSLSNMRRPVQYWDDWLVQLVVFNLDREIREDWKKSLEGTNDFHTYATLTTFLENRTKALDTAHCSDSPSPGRMKLKQNPFQNSKSATSSSKSVSVHLASSTSNQKSSPKYAGCLICKGEHYTGYCPTLLQRSISKRMDLVDSLRLCLNCLRAGHPTSNCPSRSKCKHCNGQHHSALHQGLPVDCQQSASKGDFAPPGSKPDLAKAGTNQLNAYTTSLGKATLLGTARVILKSRAGLAFEFRALVDPCSEGSFISEKAAQALRLPRMACQTSIIGVGGEVNATSRSTTVLVLCSKADPEWSLSFSAAVLSRLSAVLPREPVTLQDTAYLQGIELADPDYAQPGQIDCILGGELFPHLIEEGLRKRDPYSPVAQQTRLGWIVTGPLDTDDVSAHLNLRCFFTGASVADQLRRFWEIEELPLASALTPEEVECEQHFAATHRRDGTGRYVVRLPFREAPSLPGSRAVALSRLLSLEKRLGKDADLKAGYSKFLQDYESLGHMTGVNEAAGDSAVYLPHHAVCAKKLRVVYGAEDLNKFLHAGPKLQKDITTILTRWRMHRFVFTADIVKMFRQILVHPEDSKWQRILW